MERKILIVDDSATARALFKACMKGNTDYKIIEASNPTEAIAKAKEEKPFLIILDYNMPEKNGAELAKAMQASDIQCYYVLMSANTQYSIVQEVKALGFFDVLEKPVSVEAVLTLLEKLS